MPSQAERSRNNVRAGVFVTVALMLAVAIIVTLSGLWETITARTTSYSVRFPVSSGVGNIKPGAEVQIGGFLMGRVNSVRPVVDDDTFREIIVDFAIRAKVELYDDAQIFISTPLLGSGAWLSIPDVGTPEAGPPAGGVIEGAVGVGMLTTMLGQENAVHTGEILGNARTFTDFLAEVPQEYEARVVPVLDNANAASTDIRELTSSLRDDAWPRWSGKVDQVLDWAVAFGENVDAAVAEGHGLLTDAREMVGENREPVSRIVSNVEQASERVRDETVAKANRLLDTGTEALEHLDATLETLRRDYAAWSSDVEETLGNATLASQQLKLTTMEVRRSPWKLLYKPSVTELEHELLYDAARSFAVAASDLKAASASVDRILAQYGDRLREDPELFEQVTRNLVEPLHKYEQAQQRLFDVLVTEGP
jgi:ABC-type transporter Mla subunit MlaD